MLISKQPKLSARLPATPCTPEMRSRITQIANQENVTVAEVQRNALQFFLSQFDSKTDIGDSLPVIQATEATS